MPNFSEGRDPGRIDAVSSAFATGVETLDAHSDPVHNRTVLTLTGREGALAPALANGARACIEQIDLNRHQGAHPCIGALDVCPVVWLRPADREPARQEALQTAEAIGAAGVPVFLYGDLAADESRQERAFFRSGGLPELRRRLADGELRPDLGPPEPHPTAGATLVTARPPLAAFNVELDGATTEDARHIAAHLRETGGGLAGVRAIGIDLGERGTQVSTNVHDPVAVPLRDVVRRVRELASAQNVRVTGAEIVGLVPQATLEAWPNDIPLTFDPAKQTIERRLQR